MNFWTIISSLSRPISTEPPLVGDGRYTELGEWFDFQGYRTTINTGSQIRSTISGATTISIQYGKTPQQTNPLPTIAIRVKPIGGNWSNFTRVLLTSNQGTVPGQTYYQKQLLSGLNSSLSYQIEVVVNISLFDFIWTNGSGLLFKELILDTGSIVGTINTRPRVWFIGDSLISGDCVLGTSFNSTASASELCLISRASDSMNIQPYFNSWGGMAITHGAADVPVLTTSAFMYKSGINKTTYPNFDYIFIHLGGNDQGANIVTFKETYRTLIRALKEKAPGKPVILMRPINGIMAQQVFELSNEESTYYVNTTGWTYTKTDSVHPDTSGCITLGNYLTADLQAKFPAGM